MSATTVMNQMQTLIQASGTALATVVVEDGVDFTSGSFPAMTITAPDTMETLLSFRSSQETHMIHLDYFDRWEATTRTLEQIMTDARVVLETIKTTIRANREVTGVWLYAGLTMKTTVGTPIHDETLGFPVLQALVEVEVRDLAISF